MPSRRSSRDVGRLARLVLVLALFAGWQAALLHPLEHVDSHGHLVHLLHGHGDGHADGHDDEPSSDPSAKLCDALGALTACMADASTAIAATVFASADYPFDFNASLPADAPPFLAQAPPAQL